MRVIFHPEFPKDIQKFESDYAQILEGLALRFREEIDSAVDVIKSFPTSSGHFVLKRAESGEIPSLHTVADFGNISQIPQLTEAK